MFDRYTEKSIKVIILAREKSRRLGHNYVGTEQLLLAIISGGRGIGAKVWRSIGVTLQAARIASEPNIYDEEERARDDDLFFTDPIPRRRERWKRQDPLATLEIISILRSIAIQARSSTV
jgi:ATP-dependent Clp protease ATP-binding subunit ClpA